MSTTGGAEAGDGRIGVPVLTKAPSPSPASWARQFGIIEASSSSSSGAGDSHPLMADPPLPDRSPPRLPSMDASGVSDADSPAAAAAAAAAAAPAPSASSRASMTSSPETSSRPPQPRPPSSAYQDDDEWGENSFDDDKEPSLAFKKLSISDAQSDLASLQQLMRQGSWRAVVDKVKEVKRRALSQAPDEQLVYTTYHVLALMKLRNFSAAQVELSGVGDLNSLNFRFEKHPDLYPSKSGSMVPFGLRWLHAELPHRLGQTSTTIDRLYDLLAHCNERIDFLHASAKRLSPDNEGGTNSSTQSSPKNDEDTSALPIEEEETSSSFTGDYKGKSPIRQPATLEGSSSKLEDVGSNFMPSETLEDDDFGEFVTSALDKESNGNIVYATLIHRWRRRQEVVLCSVLGHHLEQKDFVICLNWLEDLLRKRPNDVVVLSKYGYVQLQLGDLYGARRTFATIEAICEQQGRSSSPVPASLLSRNRGLLYFSLKQYAKAVKEFDAVLDIDPGDVVSANNKALCLMYSRDLVGATQVLETVLQSSPITALNETVVLNLCSMYELASMNSVESKKTLSSWILRIAPDDFDLTCTRL